MFFHNRAKRLKQQARIIDTLIAQHGHATIYREDKQTWAGLPFKDGEAFDIVWDSIQKYLPRAAFLIPYVDDKKFIDFAVVGYDAVLTWYRFLELYYPLFVNKTTPASEDEQRLNKAHMLLEPLKAKYEAMIGKKVSFDHPEDYVYSYHTQLNEPDDLEGLGGFLVIKDGEFKTGVSEENLPPEIRRMFNDSRNKTRAEALKEGRHIMSIPTVLEFQRLTKLSSDEECLAAYAQSKIVYPELPPVEVVIQARSKAA